MQTQATTAAQVVTLNEYLEIIGRRKRLIGVFIVASTLIALLYSMFQTPGYKTAALVLVRPPLLDPTEPVERVDLLINMRTEIEVGSSINVVDLAAERLGTGVQGYELRERLVVTEVPESQVLRFTVVDSDPERAANAANEVAQAYLDWKKGEIDRSSGEATAKIQSQVTDLEARLADVDTMLGQTDPNSNAYQIAQADREFLARELAGRRRQLIQAAQLRSNPGQIIDRAVAPTSAISPNLRTNLITGFAFGALIGVLAALFRDRTDDRLVPRRDSLELLGMQILGTVPRPKGESLVTAGGTVAEAQRRLTSNMLTLTEGLGTKVLLFTSPNLGSVTPSIAGHIAASAARTQKKVLIVSANLRNSELGRTMSVEHSPGLVGVLVGDAHIEEAIRTNPRFPNLDVLLAGRPVMQPAELLQTAAFRFFVRTERENYDLIIIEAPAVNEFAEALTIASVVDGVVLMIEDGRSTKADVEYAKGQLETVGSRLLGTIRVVDADRVTTNEKHPRTALRG